NDTTARLHESGDGYLAVVEGETVGYALPRDAVAPLLEASPDSLRNRTVLDVRRADLRAVTLTRADQVTLRFTRGDDGGWSLEGHDDFERDAFEQLLTLIAPL